MLKDFLQSSPQSSQRSGHASRALIVVAAPNEATPILRGLGISGTALPAPWTLAPVTPDVDLVLTGISKSNAAGAVARVLDPARHAMVLSLGIGGALPLRDARGPADDSFAADLGSIHVASACVFADEGLETPDSFLDCSAMGFPMADVTGNAFPTDPALCSLLAPLGMVGPIATVSTCSGTDALAQRTAQRTLARVEAMEGAAVALVARRLRVPMIEVRVVSNTTGDRTKQRWTIRPALDALSTVIERLFPTPR